MKKVLLLTISALTLLALGNLPTIVVAQTITSISPTSVDSGSTNREITINGSDFQQGTTVQFDGTTIQSNYVSSTRLTATIPSSKLATAGSYDITVTNPGGNASSPMTFTVTDTGANNGTNNTADNGTSNETANLPNTGIGPNDGVLQMPGLVAAFMVVFFAIGLFGAWAIMG